MTNAELAILSLIAETPRHGYDIEQTIENRGMREWTEIGFSSIYYLLNKLEKTGFVGSELIATHGRGSARRVWWAWEARPFQPTSNFHRPKGKPSIRLS